MENANLNGTAKKRWWIAVVLGGGGLMVFCLCLCVIAIAANAAYWGGYQNLDRRGPQTSPAEAGESLDEGSSGHQIFNNTGGCSACHSLNHGETRVGPSLAGIAARAGTVRSDMTAEMYLTESIVEPEAYVVEGFKGDIMPANYGQRLSSEELEALVVFLLTK